MNRSLQQTSRRRHDGQRTLGAQWPWHMGFRRAGQRRSRQPPARSWAPSRSTTTNLERRRHNNKSLIEQFEHIASIAIERAQSDTALKRSEARKTAILESALDCIVTIDHEGQVTEFNPAAERTFGYHRDEVLGKQLADVIIPPSLREKHRQGLTRYLDTREARMMGRRVEMTAVRADGTEFPCELAISRIPLDGPPSFTGYLRDITERKQSEEQLRRSAAYLAEAQKLSMTGSFGWNVSADEHFWSDETFRIFEYEVSTKITMQLILDRVHPQDVPLVRQVIALAADGQDIDYECRLLTPSGAVKYLHVVAHGIRDQADHLEYIGAVQDITKRRLSEEALGEVRSELAHVARVASLGALTASIAHEVNQPLSGIITNASTCLRMLAVDPPNVDGARETARRTIRDGNRASDVITRLRALFSKRLQRTIQLTSTRPHTKSLRYCGANWRKAGSSCALSLMMKSPLSPATVCSSSKSSST